MNDEERLRALVRALLPFALAADDPDVKKASDTDELAIELGWEGEFNFLIILRGSTRGLTAADLRAAADALRAAGYADALTDDSARAALGGDE